MTTLPPLAALASRLRGLFYRPPPSLPVELPPARMYFLTHEMGGAVYSFEAIPATVGIGLDLTPAFGLSDVCRDALAESIRRRPEEPARYGMWTLAALRVGEEV